MEHFSCFPNLGKIEVQGLTVKKKSFFYHLSDSMAIKHVFKKASKAWLLHLNASQAQITPDIRSPLSNSSTHDDNQNQKKPVAVTVKEYRRSSPSSSAEEPAGMRLSNTFCRKNENNWLIIEDHNPLEAKKNIEMQPKLYNTGDDCKENLKGCISILENSCMNAEAISVTGIISRFFTDFDEVDSCFYQPKHPSETESVYGNNLIDSMARATTTRPDHRNCRETVESDVDAQCSIAEQKDGNTAERAKTASKAKKEESMVGKSLVRAASSIQTPGSRKMSGTAVLSMRRNLMSPDHPALLVNRNAFDGDDFAG